MSQSCRGRSFRHRKNHHVGRVDEGTWSPCGGQLWGSEDTVDFWNLSGLKNGDVGGFLDDSLVHFDGCGFRSELEVELFRAWVPNMPRNPGFSDLWRPEATTGFARKLSMYGFKIMRFFNIWTQKCKTMSHNWKSSVVSRVWMSLPIWLWWKCQPLCFKDSTKWNGPGATWWCIIACRSRKKTM